MATGGNGRIQITEESVSKVAIRIPPFWSDEPELWFAQLEGQFVLSGVTQDSTNECLFPKSTRQLLEHEELGDRRPTQFLRHLRTLAGENIPDSLLRTLWLGRLPTTMQTVLATRAEDPLNSVAEQADRIHEMTNKAVVAATATSAVPRESLEAQIQALTKQVAQLSTRLSRDKSRQHGNDRSRSRSRSQSRNRGTSKEKKDDKNNKHCYYHNRFGEKAKKCTQPCTYKSEKDQGGH
ncbi:uncharacterized protein LOC143905786 [Temnothorax americanus]|uniref:uncharacterized protein LOC143905786 n=1 Tax=Temnothorax americanus TaxID=1964332 RepID=UPI004068D3FC